MLSKSNFLVFVVTAFHRIHQRCSYTKI